MEKVSGAERKGRDSVGRKLCALYWRISCKDERDANEIENFDALLDRVRRVPVSEHVDEHCSQTCYNCLLIFGERACNKLANNSRIPRNGVVSLRTSPDI